MVMVCFQSTTLIDGVPGNFTHALLSAFFAASSEHLH